MLLQYTIDDLSRARGYFYASSGLLKEPNTDGDSTFHAESNSIHENTPFLNETKPSFSAHIAAGMDGLYRFRLKKSFHFLMEQSCSISETCSSTILV